MRDIPFDRPRSGAEPYAFLGVGVGAMGIIGVATSLYFHLPTAYLVAWGVVVAAGGLITKRVVRLWGK